MSLGYHSTGVASQQIRTYVLTHWHRSYNVIQFRIKTHCFGISVLNTQMYKIALSQHQDFEQPLILASVTMLIQPEASCHEKDREIIHLWCNSHGSSYYLKKKKRTSSLKATYICHISRLSTPLKESIVKVVAVINIPSTIYHM